MTEEERKREVERISRKTQKSVKTPSNEQRIIRIVRFKAGNLASYIGTLEEATRKAIELREHYSGIEGAYHFNKKYWNSVRFDSDVDDKLMKELIDHSYDEVIKKFTKKLRAEYDALP